MGEGRGVHRVLVGKPEGKIILRRIYMPVCIYMYIYICIYIYIYREREREREREIYFRSTCQREMAKPERQLSQRTRENFKNNYR